MANKTTASHVNNNRLRRFTEQFEPRLKAVNDAGGVTIVQDPAEAEYPDMPKNAMEGLPVTFCIGSTDIGPALDILTRRTMALETGTAVSVRILKDRVALLARLLAQSHRNPDTCRFIVTELTSLECDLRSIQDLATKAMVSAIPYGEAERR